MKHRILIAAAFLIWSCSPDPTVRKQDIAIEQYPTASGIEASGATPAVQPHQGWIACGGGWTAGIGADLGNGYADQLGERVVNAGVAGEPLPGLIERLPSLLERAPIGLILEIGHEDEALGAPLKSFQRHLNNLEQLLRPYAELELIVIVSARGETYQNAILDFAGRQSIPVVAHPYLSQPPNPQYHIDLARAIREML